MEINYNAAINSMRYFAQVQNAQRLQFSGYENMMDQMNNAFDMVTNMQGDTFSPVNRLAFKGLANNIDSISLNNRKNQLNFDLLSKMYDYANNRYQQSLQQRAQ